MNCGPSANCLGCNDMVNLKYIYLSNNINSVFKKGNKILPNIDEDDEYEYEKKEMIETEYEVLETEIFQIIIG